MIATLKKLWSPGTSGHPRGVRRQIALCNQLGLFGTAVTLPYQLFYYCYDFSMYRGVFIANLLFIAGYLSVLPLNHKRWYNPASAVLLVNGSSQLFVVTWFIGTEAGVNLYYFTLASISAFLYKRPGRRVYAAIMVSLGVQYVVTRFLFTAATAITPVPSPWVDAMYTFSVAGALTLSGIALYLFRQQIDHAEGELRLSNRYLEMLSSTDPLTGLANRRALEVALEHEWARLTRHRQALSVIMFDVDHFKRFNDRYGHDGGDRCLQQVARASRHVITRRSDLLVRYGGEEFAVVLPDTDAAGARLVGERLREAVAALVLPGMSSKSPTRVTISVGVASIDVMRPDIDALDADCLLKCADDALYQAKAGGRNRVVSRSCDRPAPVDHSVSEKIDSRTPLS
ncbi:GGDEF domain-containing protein [Kushneria sp. AK178]